MYKCCRFLNLFGVSESRRVAPPFLISFNISSLMEDSGSLEPQ